MSMSRFWRLTGAIGVVLVVVACSGGEVVNQTSSTPPPLSSTTTTSTVAPTSSTNRAGEALDLSNSMWVVHGLDGIRVDDSTLIWETNPFPTAIARDRQGGLVFADSTGLFWFHAGDIEPVRVGGQDDTYEVIAVATTPAAPVALIWGAGPTYLSLSDGSPVEAPPNPPVEISQEPPWLTWTADNGLSAWVTEPEVERDSENQPSRILEPAHLVVADAEEILVDTRIADPDQAWATIHDFDGQRIIISRGPYEPAMPEESFLLVDLATGDASEIFRAGGAKATFVGADSDWKGPVRTPVTPGATNIQPTEDDLSLVNAFIEFAKSPGAETFSSLPLADSVAFGLGPQIIHSADVEELQDPQTWVINTEHFRAYTGPFSSLTLLGSLNDYTVQIGEHSHCAGPPQPPPNGLDGHRRISVQPAGESLDSCLDWSTVDLFVGPSGQVEAITLDLWEP